MRLFKETKLCLASLCCLVLTVSCSDESEQADAYGNFEVDNTIISAQTAGELLRFDVQQGGLLLAGQIVGLIDTTSLHLQKNEILASISAARIQKINLNAQEEVLGAERANLVREKNRVEKLLKSESATTKQRDDLVGNIKVIDERIKALLTQKKVIDTQVASIVAKLGVIDHQMSNAVITNPLQGRVLTKLAQAHEIMAPGKPLYTLADLSLIDLKAFVSERQLANLALEQKVKVLIDSEDDQKEFSGKITWISDEAEFTPKIIQTKEERVNLVYAIKVRVKNDDSIKIGMPGEVKF